MNSRTSATVPVSMQQDSISRVTARRRLRIALLAAAVSPNTKSWVEGLEQSGAEVHLITFHPDDAAPGQVHSLWHVARLGKVGFLLAVPGVRKLLRQINPDLVIGYYLTSYGLVAALAASVTLVTAAAGSELLRRRDRLNRAILRHVVSKSDLIVVWADHMVPPLARLGAWPAKLLVLPRGIDQTVFSAAGRTHTNDRSCRIVWTRSLKPVYDPETSIKAVKLLLDRSYDVHFHMLGDGALRQSVRSLIERLGVEQRVHLEGAVARETVASFLKNADVYLASARSDGASASLFEAMACGTFPVVSDIPANREWIRDGVNGLLFPPEDAQAAAAALARALESPGMRAEAAARNTEIASRKLRLHCNVASMTERFQALVDRRAG